MSKASGLNGHVTPKSLKNGFFHVAHFKVAGRNWIIINRAAPAYISRRRTFQSWFILLAGLSFTGLIILYIGQRQKSERILLQTNRELSRLNEEIKNHQTQLLLSEKMSSIGQLAAGIAHEINNPAGYVAGNFDTLKRYIEGLLELGDIYDEFIDRMKGCQSFPSDFEHSVVACKKRINYDFLRLDIKDLLAESIDGMARIALIVSGLRDFSHVGNEDTTDACDLAELIDKTIIVAWNELKYKCTIHKEYGEMPKLPLNRGQITQVVLNLLVNAAHACIEKGDIYIRLSRFDDEALLEIQDTGPGIPQEIQSKIFDPFFTTKPVGKGTGLGLHICQKIVAAHGGRMEIESEIGVGTSFRIILPIRSINHLQKKKLREYWRWQSGDGEEEV